MGMGGGGVGGGGGGEVSAPSSSPPFVYHPDFSIPWPPKHTFPMWKVSDNL